MSANVVVIVVSLLLQCICHKAHHTTELTLLYRQCTSHTDHINWRDDCLRITSPGGGTEGLRTTFPGEMTTRLPHHLKVWGQLGVVVTEWWQPVAPALLAVFMIFVLSRLQLTQPRYLHMTKHSSLQQLINQSINQSIISLLTYDKTHMLTLNTKLQYKKCSIRIFIQHAD